MTYELWDFETGNAQGVYPSMLDALTVVRTALARDGHDTLRGLGLVEVQPGGVRRLVARELALIPLVGEPTTATH
jgi:hypothetical protein